MVRFSSQQGCLFKIEEFIIKIYALFVLFLTSIFLSDPREANNRKGNTFITRSGGGGSSGPGGGGGGSGGGGPGGGPSRGQGGPARFRGIRNPAARMMGGGGG